MDWFEDWFNTKYYHILYKNRNFSEAKEFIDNISKYINFKKDSIALEIGCGKGRHSYYISQYTKTIGIDLSSKSIEEAKKIENENLKFKLYDMREVYRYNYFDYIFNIFTSFGYFSGDENIKVLSNIKKSLKKGGIFIFDFINCQKAIKNLKKNEIINIDDIKFKIKRYVDNNYIIKEINVIDNNYSKLFVEKIEIIKFKKFKDYFYNLNMKIINKFGDYSLNGFDENKSDRLIIIAKN